MVGFGKSGQQDENVLPAVCIPKTAPLWTQGSQSELSLLKPLEKSVEIKKRNRGKKKTTPFSLPFLPKQVFHIQGLLVWKPFIALAHVDFFAEWKFLQDRCYFWCRLRGICCWLTTGSGCPGFDQGHGSLPSSVPTTAVSGKLRCGLNIYLPRKVADGIACEMSFSTAPEHSQSKFNFILFLVLVLLASLAYLCALTTSVEL